MVLFDRVLELKNSRLNIPIEPFLSNSTFLSATRNLHYLYYHGFYKFFYPRTRIGKKILFLKKTQWSSRKNIKSIQLKKLKIIINYAYNNIPYYKKKFKSVGLNPDDIKTLDDLSKFPTLNRSDIQKEFDNANAQNNNEIITYMTSGSTGLPLKILVDQNTNEWRQAGWARLFINHGILPSKNKFITIIGGQNFSDPHFTKEKGVSSLIRGSLYLTDKSINTITLENYYKILKHFKPDAIFGMHFRIHFLAKYLDGLDNFNIKKIFSTGNKLTNRNFLENVFNCDVLDVYGSEEVGNIAAECEEKNGLHIDMENLIVENNNKNELIITDLNNMTMPIIRYKSGDLGEVIDEDCSCGRRTLKIKSIDGRILDFVVSSSKKIIGGQFFTNIIMEKFKNKIEQFQIVQNNIDDLNILIIPSSTFTKSDKDDIKLEFENKIGSMFNINIKVVSFIKPDGINKIRMIKSKPAYNLIRN